MRKFIAFLKKFRVFLVFFILQILALSAYFSVMSFQRTVFFNSSQSFVATMMTWERNITKYLYLDEANRELQEENIELQNRIADNFISIDTNVAIVNDSLRSLSFEYAPATVINSSYTFLNNFFTIDVGSESGIKKKMGVISSHGIVGYVHDVSKHYAVVRSILTSNINISAFVEESEAFGLIKYEGDDPTTVKLTGISNDIVIQEGGHVFATGSGGYFPQGTPIGIVEKMELIEGKPLWDITVRLNQDMRRLRYVYVIHNINDLEIENLESKYEQLR